MATKRAPKTKTKTKSKAKPAASHARAAPAGKASAAKAPAPASKPRAPKAALPKARPAAAPKAAAARRRALPPRSPAARPSPATAPKQASPRTKATASGPARQLAKAPARKPAEPALPPAETGEQDPAAIAKLQLGPAADELEPKPATIPWSYAQDRVTAAAVDPDRLYVYWEVTDPAVERARAALGPGGAGAWLNLRVHDTSGLLFDGTNSHSSFDHGLDPATRQWFFHVGKPTSSAVVEIGLRSSEGHFARIARSGRVDFPRRAPAPWRDPEWMTVRPWTGEVAGVHRSPAPAWAAAPARYGPPEGGPALAPPRFEQIPLWTMREPGEAWETILRQAMEQGWERVEWREATGEGWFALEGHVEWESPHVISSWESGPFSYPVEIEAPSKEEWAGKAFAFRVGGVTHVVYGPWRVVIRNLGARAEHATLGSWVVYRSWTVEAGHEVLRPGARVVALPGGSEQLLLGASERRWQAASELRLAGASELWRAGASELAFRGASERVFMGASELRARGASERLYAGASERRLGGASERQHAGASEARLGGASERQHLGGSEARLEGGEAAPTLPYPAVTPGRPTGEE